MRKGFIIIVLAITAGACSRGDDPVSDAKKYCRCLEKAEQGPVTDMPKCFEIYDELKEKYAEKPEDWKVMEERMKECSKW